ncbi:MAG: NrdJb [Gammaproteobacteria bacterium]|nr:NrdJb [Gammaproteobacteria bacterium]
MTVRIEKKIVGYKVGGKDAAEPEAVAGTDDAATEKQPAGASHEGNIVRMHEKLERPEMLVGSTYKVKTPLSEHALYVTINDIILNIGTENEKRRPFEIFINSKNMDHFQWIVALTRIISAVFRKGGDVTFLVEELRSVFDPRGGYFKKGGKYMPSLVAEIGDAIECHMRMIGLLKDDGLDEHQQKLVAEKRAQFEAVSSVTETADSGDFPAGAQLCTKCHTKAAIQMDGCLTCLNCGESKCG